MNNMKIGFIGFGEVNTPREMIEAKCLDAKERLKKHGFCIVDGGVVTDEIGRTESAKAIERLKNQEFDLLVLCVAGWIPSYAVIRTADPFKDKPMVLWGLCGGEQNGRLVTTAEQAGTSALRKPMKDLGFTFYYTYDTTDGIDGTNAILKYCQIVKAKKELLTAKAMMVGYRDMNLYGTMFDGISLKKSTGIEIEFIEMLEMTQRTETVSADEASRFLGKIKKEWHFTKEADDETLMTGIRYFLALREIVKEKGYEAISLIDVDGMKKLLGFPPSMVFMLLANELNICTIPENDALGNATQLIVHKLTGQIGAYLEVYEFMKDRVLMGVPDYVPQEIVEGDYNVMPTKFGLLDSCILNVSKLKTGPVTICRLFPTAKGYGMHIALAQAEQPRSWEEAGWTPPVPQLPSLEMVLGDKTTDFTSQIMGQHYILAYGDHVKLLSDFCLLCGIEPLLV